MLGVKKSASEAWRALPPSARERAPVVGAGVGGAAAAGYWGRRRIAVQRVRADVAEAAVVRLTSDNGKLRDAVKTLRAAAATPRAAADTKAAAAVAEATQAAAAAASAAAEGARFCVVRLRAAGPPA